MIGSSFYILYCCQLLYTSSMMIYTSAVLLGAGAALVWVALGFLMANNSESETRYRSGVCITISSLISYGLY